MTPKAKKAVRKKAAAKGRAKGRSRSVGVMVPAKNGGRIWKGAPANPVAGPGRPKDEVRAKYLSLGATKGYDFIDSLLEGKVTVSLLGKCDECAHEQPINGEIVEHIIERVGVSIDHRLKANEQAMKYGTQSKELVIADLPDAEKFFNCISRACVEMFGEAAANNLKARAVALMDGKA